MSEVTETTMPELSFVGEKVSSESDIDELADENIEENSFDQLFKHGQPRFCSSTEHERLGNCGKRSSNASGNGA